VEAAVDEGAEAQGEPVGRRYGQHHYVPNDLDVPCQRCLKKAGESIHYGWGDAQ
jgi:hypothetical protein